MDFSKADRETIAEMQHLIEQERRKPADKRDYDLIEQLTAVIYEATSSVDLSEIAEQNIAEIEKISMEKTRDVQRTRWTRRFVGMAACAMLFIGLNAWTLHVYGMGLPKTIYQMTKGGISFQMTDLDSNIIELPVSEDDPYGIRTECEKHGFSPLTPAYLPNDLVLSVLDSNDATTTAVNFIYRNSQDPSKTVSFNYTYIAEQQRFEDTDFGFPSDEHNIRTEEINGKTVLISWEDGVFHAAFCDSNKHIVYQISTNYIGYDESYQMLRSYFE